MCKFTGWMCLPEKGVFHLENKISMQTTMNFDRLIENGDTTFPQRITQGVSNALATFTPSTFIDININVKNANYAVNLQTTPHYLFLIYFLCKQMNPYGDTQCVASDALLTDFISLLYN